MPENLIVTEEIFSQCHHCGQLSKLIPQGDVQLVSVNDDNDGTGTGYVFSIKFVCSWCGRDPVSEAMRTSATNAVIKSLKAGFVDNLDVLLNRLSTENASYEEEMRALETAMFGPEEDRAGTPPQSVKESRRA